MRVTKLLVRIGGGIFLGLVLWSGVELFLRASGTGGVLGFFSNNWTYGISLYAAFVFVIGVICLWAIFSPEAFLNRGLLSIEDALEGLSFSRWIIAFVFIMLPSIILLGPWGYRFNLPVFRIVLLLTAALAAGMILPGRPQQLLHRLALAVLGTASLFILGRYLILITEYPFAIGWSDGNRIWDYSLYFCRSRYMVEGGFSYPTYMTPGRHGLWGLPFLIPGVTIGAMRAWDGVLWTAPYLLLGLTLFSSRRINLSTTMRWVLVLWSFLFLWQGPIYTPLVLSAALLVWGYDRRHFGRSLLVTALACFYAGISRWTWLVAPGIWAAIWALLEDVDTEQSWLRRLKRPIALGLAGLAGGAASQVVQSLAFPRENPVYATALKQELLWYRLFPNPTNTLGIVPGLILATGPVILILGWVIVKGYLKWDGLQLLGLTASLAAFLGVGVVASLKIGGGSNLHNLDMLLLAILLFAAIGLYQIQGKRIKSIPVLVRISIALAAIIPACLAIRTGEPLRLPDKQVVDTALATMSVEIQAASEKGEVLFIDQRQLLTFGEIENVPLVMDYELKDMMNQAMGRNGPYFERFYADLENHRFSMIVSDPLAIVYQGSSHQFGEENDLWVEQVAVPLLEYYRPEVKLGEVGVWLMVPAEGY